MDRITLEINLAIWWEWYALRYLYITPVSALRIPQEVIEATIVLPDLSQRPQA